MLVIGLSDNTRLESYVSLYKTFCHVNMTAHTVELMFLYHAGLELERTQLKAPEMRSAHGGALKASAKGTRSKSKAPVAARLLQEAAAGTVPHGIGARC